MQAEIFDEVPPDIDRLLNKGSRAPIRRREGSHPPEQRWLLMRSDDEAVVAACRLRIWGEWATVEAIWVDPPHRGKGFGRALVLAAEESARDGDLRGLEATIYGLNTPEFFLRCGFQAVGQLESGDPDQAKVWVVKSFAPLKLAFPAQASRARRKNEAAG